MKSKLLFLPYLSFDGFGLPFKKVKVLAIVRLSHTAIK